MASTEDPQAEVLRFLSLGQAFGQAGPPERIDTHAAIVFLAGDRAWKLKRAVRFDYLDFSSSELRRAALEAELRLNRRTTATLYCGVRAVTRDRRGRLAINGAGDPVDWLLEMRRFPADALLQHVAEAGNLDDDLLMHLADSLVAFHAAAEESANAAGAETFRRIIEGNRISMAAFPGTLDQNQALDLAERLLRMVDDLAPVLDVRARTGRVRHGHGDLHLANIALIDGKLTPFDCLEFSKELATIDVLYDLAFLLMDLWQGGWRVEANIVLNRYLDLSPADEAGIVLMPLFLATRAAVRAHVLAAEGEQTSNARARAEATRFLDCALGLLASPAPRLVAIGGLSGTGKSTLARRLAGRIGRAPGARVVRSDVLRKRLAGTALPETTLSPDHYSVESSARVYTALGEAATAALAAGQSVIADAVFATSAERQAIAATVSKAGIPFSGIWLEASLATRLERLNKRMGDASDADASVARLQAGMLVGDLDDWHCLPSMANPEAIVLAVTMLLGVS